MSKTFGVHPRGGPEDERWSINPDNVVIVRPRTIVTQDDDGVEVSREEVTEVLFVNTFNAESSILTDMSYMKVRELMDDAMRG